MWGVIEWWVERWIKGVGWVDGGGLVMTWMKLLVRWISEWMEEAWWGLDETIDWKDEGMLVEKWKKEPSGWIEKGW